MSSSDATHPPVEAFDCLCCMDAVDDSSVCDFRTDKSDSWVRAKYCCGCTQMLLDTQYVNFMKQIELAASGSPEACKKAIRTMIERGSPIYISDRHAFSCEDGETVVELWFGSDKAVHPARLTGSLDGAAHKEQWEFYREFLPGLARDEDPE